jgi:hypothetical protein
MKGSAASEKGANKPLEFIQAIQPEKHVALFYEDDAYARNLEFRFIETGIRRQEHCFYITHSDDESHSLENQMKESRVIREGITKGLVSTYRDSFVPETPMDAVSLIEERRSRMAKEFNGPCRVIGTIFTEVKTPEQIAVLAGADEAIQQFISGSSTIVLCSLASSTVLKELRSDWFLKMILNHNSAIFAPKRSEGVAFDMR